MKCKAITHKGIMCSRVAGVSGFCHLHDPARLPELRRQMSIAGKSRSNLLDSLHGLKIKDSSDIAEAVRLIIEKMLKGGTITSDSKLKLLAGYIKIYSAIEKDALVPKKMKDLEKLIASMGVTNLDRSSHLK